MQEADPDRVVNVPTIRTMFTNLCRQDFIRRVRRTEKAVVLWAVADHPAAAGPYGADTMTEVVEKVLLESGPMRMTELAVAIKATGYRPHAGHRLLMKCIEGSFKRNPEKFRKGEDARWAAGH